MRSEPSREAPAPLNERIAGPVAVWVAIGLAPLLLSAAEVQLWARAEQPAEKHALEMMLATLLAASAALFPWLLRSIRSTTFVILLALPLVQLAGMLSAANAARTASCAATVGIWLVSLALWRSALTGITAQLLGSALSCGILVGGPGLAYLRAEFHSQSPQIPLWPSPILLGVILVSGISVSLAAQFRARRQHPSRYPHLSHRPDPPNSGKTPPID